MADLLRIPTVCRSVNDLLGVAAKLALNHAVLLAQRDNENLVFLTTDLSTAEANYMLDQIKSILVGPPLEPR